MTQNAAAQLVLQARKKFLLEGGGRRPEKAIVSLEIYDALRTLLPRYAGMDIYLDETLKGTDVRCLFNVQ